MTSTIRDKRNTTIKCIKNFFKKFYVNKLLTRLLIYIVFFDDLTIQNVFHVIETTITLAIEHLFTYNKVTVLFN